MGLGGSLYHAGELLKQPVSSRSGQVCPRSCPKCRAQRAPLIWAKVGVLRRVRENVVKSGHVVGLGSSLVLNPSRESRLIGYAGNLGRLQSEACRFTHGAGWKRFLRLQCTSLTRAETVDLPARIDVHEYVCAHLGPASERHTENTASLSLDFRAKYLARPMLQVAQINVPFTVYSPAAAESSLVLRK
jgi:hypothetical protein